MSKDEIEFEELPSREVSLEPVPIVSDSKGGTDQQNTAHVNPKVPVSSSLLLKGVAVSMTTLAISMAGYVGSTHFAERERPKEVEAQPLKVRMIERVSQTGSNQTEVLVDSSSESLIERSAESFADGRNGESSNYSPDGERPKSWGFTDIDPPIVSEFSATVPVRNVLPIRSTEGSAEDAWVLNQLKGSSIEHDKDILQLQAQVALLQLELTKQRSETFAAMQAASEAASIVLGTREVLKQLKHKVVALGGDVKSHGKLYDSLARKFEDLDQKKKTPLISKKSKVVKAEQAVRRSTKIPSTKQMVSFSPVMVTERGAFVLNTITNDRRVLEVGAKYPDLGRVTKVDPKTNQVFGLTNDGLAWVIKK